MSRNYSFSEYFKRALWIITIPFFILSPRHLYGWRTFLLRLFGARIGKKVKIFPSVKVKFPWELVIGNEVVISWNVTLYNLGKLTIGDKVVISQGAHLCGGTHAYENKNFPLVKSPISIGEGVWIAADAFIGPDVMIGKGCVIGSRAVVVKSTEDFGVYAGNPAHLVKKRNNL